MSSSPLADDRPQRNGWILIGLWTLWGIGLAMNSMLAWQHHLLRSTGTVHGLPGCGEPAIPCQIVLGSSYSQLFGLSITTFAFVFYAAVGAALVAVGLLSKRNLPVPFGLLLLLVSSAGPIVGGWLTFVMMTRIGATCYWCLANHTVNALLFLASLAYATRQWKDCRRQRLDRELSPLSARPLIAAGAVIALGGAWLLFILQPSPESRKLRIIEVEWLGNPAAVLGFADADSGESSLQSFKGAPDAPDRLVFFTCFTCPYCAQINRELNDVLAKHPGRLRVDVRVFPLSPDCNDAPIVKRSPPGHHRACELARLALAVASVDPAAFSEFVDWAYAQGEGASGNAAFAEASRLVGKERLELALANSAIDAQLEEDLALAKKAQFVTVPKLYMENGQLGGRLEKGNMARLLEKEFGWPAGSAGGP